MRQALLTVAGDMAVIFFIIAAFLLGRYVQFEEATHETTAESVTEIRDTYGK